MEKFLIVFYFLANSIFSQTWESTFQEYQNLIDNNNYLDALIKSKELIDIAKRNNDNTKVLKSYFTYCDLALKIDTIPLSIIENHLLESEKIIDKNHSEELFQFFSLMAQLKYFESEFILAINYQENALNQFAKVWGIKNLSYFNLLYNLFLAQNLSNSSLELNKYANQMVDVFILDDSIKIDESKTKVALKIGEYFYNCGNYEKAKQLYLFVLKNSIEKKEREVCYFTISEVCMHLQDFKSAFKYLNDFKKESISDSLNNSNYFHLCGLLEYYQNFKKPS